MKRKCAYCGNSKKLTKEHVISDFLYELNQGRKVGFNAKANKVIESEHVVKDVCEKCNNTHLSILDSYGKKFYIENKLDQHYPPNLTVNFNFEYELLLRFLLKLSYNQSRMTNKRSSIYSDLKQYILTGSHSDFNKNLRLFLEVLSKYKLTLKDKAVLKEKLENTKYQNEEIGDYMSNQKYAIGHVDILNDEKYEHTEILSPELPVSYVIINAYIFYILHFNPEVNSQEIDGFLGNDIYLLKYTKRLTKRNEQTAIKVSRRNIKTHPLIRVSHSYQRDSWDDYYSRTAYLDDIEN